MEHGGAIEIREGSKNNRTSRRISQPLALTFWLHIYNNILLYFK